MNKLSTKQFIFNRKTANECDLNIIVSEVSAYFSHKNSVMPKLCFVSKLVVNVLRLPIQAMGCMSGHVP